jgi:AcrR family transcriptional regulator
MERKGKSSLGRPRTIDRDKVLDAAEAVVAEIGAAGLTIDAVAKASGITKGGVQYCFGTKEGLLTAMLDRWCASFDRDIAALQGEDPDPLAHVRAYVEAGRQSDEEEGSRSAVMLATLLQNSDQLETSRLWYREQLKGVDPSSEAGRKARLAFIAAEGVFFLRSFRLLELSDGEWRSIYEDILAMLPDKSRKKGQA